MTYRVLYDPFLSMTSTTLTQRFSPSRKMLLKYIRCQIVLVNNPTITSLHVRIFDEILKEFGTNQRNIILADSQTRDVTEFATNKNGIYDIYFKFTDNIWLNENCHYHFGIRGDGYTYSDDAHVGWVRDWPVNNYGFDYSSKNLREINYRYHIAGQRFRGI